jgi:transcriptional regulator with XRE-family HTH domain
MWHENLLRIIKEKNLSPRQIAEDGNVSEKTVIRVIKHPNNSCYLDTLDKIAKGAHCTLEDIVLDTRAVIGTESLAVLQEKAENLQKQLEVSEREKGLLFTDNNLLKTEVTTLTSRLELTETKLMYCEKLLAVYERYNKPKTE